LSFILQIFDFLIVVLALVLNPRAKRRRQLEASSRLDDVEAATGPQVGAVDNTVTTFPADTPSSATPDQPKTRIKEKAECNEKSDLNA